MTKTGKDYFAPSRAREILASLGWVKNLDYASQNLVFHFHSPGVNLLVLNAGGENVTGLANGKLANWSKTSSGGIDVVFSTQDASVLPNTEVAISDEKIRGLRLGLENITHLKALPGADALLRATFPKLKAGNGSLLFELQLDLCNSLFGAEAYQGWRTKKDTRRKSPDEPKVKLDNYYQRPVPGRMVQHGDIIEDNENVWFEVDVEWPADLPSTAFYAVPPRKQKGHHGKVSRLHCDWTVERVSSEVGTSSTQSAAPQLGLSSSGSVEGNHRTAVTGAAEGTSAANVAAPQQSKIESRGMSQTVAGTSFQSTVLAEVAHKFKLDPGEDVGRFRVSVQASYPEYFESALFSEEFDVKSRSRAMAELRTAAREPKPAPMEKSSKPAVAPGPASAESAAKPSLVEQPSSTSGPDASESKVSEAQIKVQPKTAEPEASNGPAALEKPWAAESDPSKRTTATETVTLPPAQRQAITPERETELRAALLVEFADLPIYAATDVGPKGAKVRYRDGELALDVGPEATARHIDYHVETVRDQLKFRGPLGRIRRILDWILHTLRVRPGFGSAGFEAIAEVKKLRAMERDVRALQQQAEQGLARIENGKALTPADLQQELTSILEQIETHEQRKGSYDPGTGEIAARDLPVLAVTKDTLLVDFSTSSSEYFEMDIRVTVSGGAKASIGTGSVRLGADGQPVAAPDFYFNTTHWQNGVEYKVNIFDSVEPNAIEGALPVGKGERHALTKLAIASYAREYQNRFGRPMNEIGGSLAMENKANFQRALIDIMTKKRTVEMPTREPTQSELIEAVKEISYGAHRQNAGYSEFEVTIPIQKKWEVASSLGAEFAKLPVPRSIDVIARKK